ncbi:MAG: hypothetical protein DHS80DRAFT_32875 [Piptocephalis tieghemiana]|nr:MAG: hypothetical protein DHS80DRAFT_32875 [Piptocephalis tieghemiana]
MDSSTDHLEGVQHTFCSACIQQSLAFAPVCPIDRSPLQVTQLGPTVLIVQSLLDELRVQCPEEECEEEMERQHVRSHLDEECNFRRIPCPHEGCDERVARGKMGEHVRTCSCRPKTQCPACHEVLGEGMDMGEHLEQCQDRVSEDICQPQRCQRCGEMLQTRSQAQEEEEEEEEEGEEEEEVGSRVTLCSSCDRVTPLVPCCTAGPYACPVRLTIGEIEAHRRTCPLVHLAYLRRELGERVDQQDMENARLASRVSELEEALEATREVQDQHQQALERDMDPMEGQHARERRLQEEMSLVLERLGVLELRMGRREAASAGISDMSDLQEELVQVRDTCRRLGMQVNQLMARSRQGGEGTSTGGPRGSDVPRQRTKL